MSRQTKELTARGLVRARPAQPSSRVGRPHIPIEIDTRYHLVCGLHIALHHWTVVLMDLRGKVLAERRIPHRDPRSSSVLADIGVGVRAFVGQHAARGSLLGVGVAVGGWVDPVRRIVIRHSQLGWCDVPVGEVLEEQIGLPVRVESHSTALAHAEQLIGRYRTRARSSMVHLFVGNVVDAAIVTGGTVHRGPRSAAGNVSHLPVGGGSVLPAARCSCARFGCVQATVADRALTDHVTAQGLMDAPSFVGILDALEGGASWATEVFRDRVRLVGQAAAMLIDVVNPEIVVVVEAGLARRPELLADLHGEVAAHSHTCDDPKDTVHAGSFGIRSLGVAAGSVVLHETYLRPLDVPPIDSPARRR